MPVFVNRLVKLTLFTSKCWKKSDAEASCQEKVDEIHKSRSCKVMWFVHTGQYGEDKTYRITKKKLESRAQATTAVQMFEARPRRSLVIGKSI